MELARCGIAEIKSVNAAKAAELQTCLDRVIKLAEKAVPLHHKIDTLRKKARDKTQKGLDDTEDYCQAEKIYQAESLLWFEGLKGCYPLDFMIDEMRRGTVLSKKYMVKKGNE